MPCWTAGSLTKITLPPALIAIGKGAFYRSRSLTEITLPAALTAIHERAFELCTSLTEITLPAPTGAPKQPRLATVRHC